MTKDKVLYIRCTDNLHEQVQKEQERRTRLSPARIEQSLSETARILLAERLAQLEGAKKPAAKKHPLPMPRSSARRARR